jgi:hypothetical protein
MVCVPVTEQEPQSVKVAPIGQVDSEQKLPWQFAAHTFVRVRVPLHELHEDHGPQEVHAAAGPAVQEPPHSVDVGLQEFGHERVLRIEPVPHEVEQVQAEYEK